MRENFFWNSLRKNKHVSFAASVGVSAFLTAHENETPFPELNLFEGKDKKNCQLSKKVAQK